MLIAALICIAISVATILLFVLEVAPGRNELVAQRLAELQNTARDTPKILQQRKRQARTDRLKAVVAAFGEFVAVFRDALAAPTLRDALGFLLRPPCWKPGGAGATALDLKRSAGLVPG